jgi:hypothetical protein
MIGSNFFCTHDDLVGAKASDRAVHDWFADQCFQLHRPRLIVLHLRSGSK